MHTSITGIKKYFRKKDKKNTTINHEKTEMNKKSKQNTTYIKTLFICGTCINTYNIYTCNTLYGEIGGIHLLLLYIIEASIQCYTAIISFTIYAYQHL